MHASTKISASLENYMYYTSKILMKTNLYVRLGIFLQTKYKVLNIQIKFNGFVVVCFRIILALKISSNIASFILSIMLCL